VLVQVLRNYIQTTNYPQRNKRPLPQAQPVGLAQSITQNDIFVRQTLLFGRQADAKKKALPIFGTKKLSQIDTGVKKPDHQLLFGAKKYKPKRPSGVTRGLLLTTANVGVWPAESQSKGAFPVYVNKKGFSKPKRVSSKKKRHRITYSPSPEFRALPPIPEHQAPGTPNGSFTDMTPLLLTLPEIPHSPTSARSIISQAAQNSFHEEYTSPVAPMSPLSTHTPLQAPSIGPYRHGSHVQNTTSLATPTMEEIIVVEHPRRPSKRRRNSSSVSNNSRPHRRPRWDADLESVAPGSAISRDDYGSRFDRQVIRNQHRYP